MTERHQLERRRRHLEAEIKRIDGRLARMVGPVRDRVKIKNLLRRVGR